MPSPSAQLLHESRLLVPYPLTAHLNDWPIFSLSNCHVTDPSSSDSSELVNLLHADALRPLTLTGTLSSPSKDQAHLFLPPSPSHPHHLHKLYTIQVTDIKQYAYGQYEDGGVEIWVAGQAGWFTVKPSRSYKSVHQGMVQAIQLLYFAADVYKASQEQLQESHKGRGRPRKYSVDRTDVSAANVFAQYADAHPSICASSEEAAELFYTHKRFLMSSMLAGKEGLSWSAIPIFRHLEHKFPVSPPRDDGNMCNVDKGRMKFGSYDSDLLQTKRPCRANSQGLQLPNLKPAPSGNAPRHPSILKHLRHRFLHRNPYLAPCSRQLRHRGRKGIAQEVPERNPRQHRCPRHANRAWRVVPRNQVKKTTTTTLFRPGPPRKGDPH